MLIDGDDDRDDDDDQQLLAEQLLAEDDGFHVSDPDPTGDRPGRPPSGMTEERDLADLVWEAAAESDIDLRRIRIVTEFPEQTPKKRELIGRRIMTAVVSRSNPASTPAPWRRVRHRPPTDWKQGGWNGVDLAGETGPRRGVVGRRARSSTA
jgi:hypothetical protein